MKVYVYRQMRGNKIMRVFASLEDAQKILNHLDFKPVLIGDSEPDEWWLFANYRPEVLGILEAIPIEKFVAK